MDALSLLRTKKWYLLALAATSSIPVSIDLSKPKEAGLLNLVGSCSTTVECQGNLCGGSGGSMNREYSYLVTPDSAKGCGSITQVDIGIHFAASQISGIVAPAGWGYVYVNEANSDDPKTGHGNTTSFSGQCPLVMRWSGQAQTNQFEIAFNGPDAYHDVHWDTSDGSAVNWSLAVGWGYGPVHSPRFGWVPVSADGDEGSGSEDE